MKCVEKSGATLVIKDCAYREEAKSKGAIGEAFNRNFNRWFRHVTDTTNGLGVDIEERDFVAVTGCVLTKEWTMSTFEESSYDVDVQLTVQSDGIGSIGLGAWCEWESTIDVPHHSGPAPLEPPPSAASTSTQVHEEFDAFNQCIFIKVYRRSSRLERALQKLVRSVQWKTEESRDLPTTINPSLQIPALKERLNEELERLEHLEHSSRDSVCL